METITAKKVRVFRGEETILKILDECKKSNVAVNKFCADNGISPGTFHNWKKKYSNNPVKPDAQPGFTTLQINSSARVAEPGLFAEVNGIKIYQPVTAAYLKELSV